MSAPVSGPDQIIIRECNGIGELNACVALQKEVWRFDDVDLIPLRMFVVSQKIGGQVIGAFDGQELVGFAFSIPGSRAGHTRLGQPTAGEHRAEDHGRGQKNYGSEHASSL